MANKAHPDAIYFLLKKNIFGLGKTINFPKRVASYITHNPEPLDVLAVIEELPGNTEKELKAKFKQYLYNSNAKEWYSFVPEIKQYIIENINNKKLPPCSVYRWLRFNELPYTDYYISMPKLYDRYFWDIFPNILEDIYSAKPEAAKLLYFNVNKPNILVFCIRTYAENCRLSPKYPIPYLKYCNSKSFNNYIKSYKFKTLGYLADNRLELCLKPNTIFPERYYKEISIVSCFEHNIVKKKDLWKPEC